MTTGDPLDPFRNDERNGEILPFQKHGPALIRFAKVLTREDADLCIELGKRCSALIVQLSLRHPPGTVIPPHPLHSAVDWAVIHVHRGLDLRQCLNIDDLSLTSQYSEAVKHLDRVNLTLSKECRLNLPLRSGLNLDRVVQRIKLSADRMFKPKPRK